ncbi:MAG: hypothetical protein UT01_C0056G0011 [Candidatus Daviesbacteria bacterium GW2011_GWA1_38_7]|nr:MAG: hypothetical protein UT01_C0056G0011 [Candidatus Daviesbacteria bacterium GW2011_GWA1_38_7]
MFLKKPKKALFIDGSNFYHCLKEEGFEPNQLHFGKFCEKIVGEQSPAVYYYTALRKQEDDPNKYAAQLRFHQRIQSENPNLRLRLGKLQYRGKTNDDDIRAAAKAMGFIKQDIEKLPRLFESMQLTKEYKEKGVDVKLAIDLVEFSINNKLDIAIVLSGDADLVPAVALARKFKKRVINAHLFTGSAAELRNASDSHFTIGKETLKDCWRKQEGMQS